MLAGWSIDYPNYNYCYRGTPMPRLTLSPSR